MFRGIPVLTAGLYLNTPSGFGSVSQAGDALGPVPEGMRITVGHRAGKESLGFSSLFFQSFI